MKKLFVLALLIITFSSCSFINDSEVQNTNTWNTIVQNSNSSNWTTRKIKNIKRVRTNSWTTSTGSNVTLNSSNNIQSTNNATDNSTSDDKIWNSIEELSKINISEANINTETWITETGWIEDVSEEQVSQLVDILLEAGK